MSHTKMIIINITIARRWSTRRNPTSIGPISGKTSRQALCYPSPIAEQLYVAISISISISVFIHHITRISDAAPFIRFPILRASRAKCDNSHWGFLVHGRIRPLLAGGDAIHCTTDGKLRHEHLKRFHRTVLG